MKVGIRALRVTPIWFPVMIALLGTGVRRMPVKVPSSFWPAMTLVPALIEAYKMTMNMRSGMKERPRLSSIGFLLSLLFERSIASSIICESVTFANAHPLVSRR